MRLRHNKNAIILLEDSEFYINNFPYELKENTVLEIGMGKGKCCLNLLFASRN